MPNERRDYNTGVSDGVSSVMVVLWPKRSKKNLIKNLKKVSCQKTLSRI